MYGFYVFNRLRRHLNGRNWRLCLVLQCSILSTTEALAWMKVYDISTEKPEVSGMETKGIHITALAFWQLHDTVALNTTL